MTAEDFLRLLRDRLDGKTLRMKEKREYVLYYGRDEIWVVANGVFISERNNDDGTQIGSGIYTKGSILGLNALQGNRGMVSCIALMESTVIGYRTSELLSLMRENFDVHMYITSYSIQRMMFLMKSLEMNSLRTVEEKIDYFDELLNRCCQPYPPNISDSTRAQFLGVNPTSISRARSKKYNNKEN